jgi:hypothetical protein
MKFSYAVFSSAIAASCLVATLLANTANADLVKMCLFYKPAGHVRTDPILNKDCVSDHVHTFYGPQLFHPRTTPEDLRNSDPRFSTSPWEENKSLYWHPTIYKVGQDPATGEPTYEIAEVSFSGPYYRWDRDAPAPRVEAFPKGFQMIAGMDPNTPGLDLFSECLCPTPCQRADGLCESDSDFFPSDACGMMGIAMAFPTCWDDSKGIGDNGDPFSHMAYTIDGTVAGECPEGYNRRLPQIQLFVRLHNYEGGKYTFSDNTLPGDKEVFHADFMNGWEEGVLEDIVENCNPLPGEDPDDYNPECTCDQFLTEKATLLEEDPGDAEAAKICPIDVRAHIVDEEINFGVGGLPRGSCSAPVIEGVAPPFVEECGLQYTPNEFDEGACEDSEDFSGSGSEDGSSSEDFSGSEEGSEDEDESEEDSEDESEEFSEDEDESEEFSEDESEEFSEDEDESEEFSEDEDKSEEFSEDEESEESGEDEDESEEDSEEFSEDEDEFDDDEYDLSLDNEYGDENSTSFVFDGDLISDPTIKSAFMEMNGGSSSSGAPNLFGSTILVILLLGVAQFVF